MFTIFAKGIISNLWFVLSGLLKQYLIASYLTVSDFGFYGSAVAIAAFLLTLLPFPAYMNVMLRGFSVKFNAIPTRARLTKAIYAETAELAFLIAITCMIFLFSPLFTYPLDLNVVWVLLLLLVQYLGTCLDIILRMHKSHNKIAQFMFLRNIPVIALLLICVPDSVMQIILIDFLSASLITAYFSYTSGYKFLKSRLIRFPRLSLDGEQLKLWFARLSQLANSSILRLLVPIIFGGYESGLFFFALVAQLPCSLFLSMTTQIFGHELADHKAKNWSSLLKIQAWFILPNILYLILVIMILPFWMEITSAIPKIVKYSEAGDLILPLVLYSAILSSDCQEYLLRSRKLSHMLLFFYSTSLLLQLGVIAIGVHFNFELWLQVFCCSFVLFISLLLFTFHSFKRVINQNTLGAPA